VYIERAALQRGRTAGFDGAGIVTFDLHCRRRLSSLRRSEKVPEGRLPAPQPRQAWEGLYRAVGPDLSTGPAPRRLRPRRLTRPLGRACLACCGPQTSANGGVKPAVRLRTLCVRGTFRFARNALRPGRGVSKAAFRGRPPPRQSAAARTASVSLLSWPAYWAC